MDVASVLDFVLSNKWIILFYLIIILVIYFNRSKFQFQAKFIAMYRAKWGIPLMQRIADKHSEIIKILGYIGIGVGFIGMLVIVGYLVQGIYSVLFVPEAPATFSLVIPGVKIPGSPVFVPFWYGIISLFIVVVIHEFSHGVVAKAHGLKVQNTGVVFFGPLIGAFVEPDEKAVVKKDDVTQLSLFAAGPFSNVLLAAVVALLLAFIVSPIQASMVEFNGVSFGAIQESFPAAAAGVQAGTVYTKINGKSISTSADFIQELSCANPGDVVLLESANASSSIITAESPSEKGKAYIGVLGVNSEYSLKAQGARNSFLFGALSVISNLFEWIVILSLGIGLANLLPLGPVDGGRMIQLVFLRTHGKEKGNKHWKNLSILVFFIVVILILLPIIKGIFF